MGGGVSPPPHLPNNNPTKNKFYNPNIDQLDGNVSFLSETNESESFPNNEVNTIPVHISSARPIRSQSTDRGKPVRKTVYRDNRILQSISLPVVHNLTWVPDSLSAQAAEGRLG